MDNSYRAILQNEWHNERKKQKYSKKLENKDILWEWTTEHKKNIANEMNFKYKISEGIRKYCRGGKWKILFYVAKQTRIINMKMWEIEHRPQQGKIWKSKGRSQK